MKLVDRKKLRQFMSDLRFQFKFAVFGVATYALVVWIWPRG